MKIDMKLPVAAVTSAHKEAITAEGLYFFMAREIVWKDWFMFLVWTKMYWLVELQESAIKEQVISGMCYRHILRTYSGAE